MNGYEKNIVRGFLKEENCPFTLKKQRQDICFLTRFLVI